MAERIKRRNESLRKTYGFDDISLSPNSTKTIDPSLCHIKSKLGEHELDTPILASAMDSVVSPNSAAKLSKEGVLGVLNLHGLWTRYEDVESKLKEISEADLDQFVPLMQKLYSAPIKEELIAQRVQEMKAHNIKVAVSSVPQDAKRLDPVLTQAGADFLFVQSTVTSLEFIGHNEGLDIADLCKNSKLTVVVGNCVDYHIAYELMKTGAAGILAGIGPGSACTSRGVLGIGVPMATTIMDCADARDQYFSETGKKVAVIADGGLINAGDICKSIACGADFTMFGSIFARAEGAPGNGYHWGMATPSPVLPRGTRIKVNPIGSYETIINGPATLDNGFHNLTGALKTSMATLGAQSIEQMQEVEVIIAQSILKEGKIYQNSQQLGMGKK